MPFLLAPHVLRVVLVGLAGALAACAPGLPSGSPTPAPSGPVAPGGPLASPAPGASPSAPAGAQAVQVRQMALRVAGVDYPVDLQQATFTPTDLLGKRMRFGLTVGQASLGEGQGSVSFLFGQPKGLYPSFTIEEGSQTVFSVQVQVWPAKTFAVNRYQLTTNTSKVTTKTLSAQEGKVRGRLEVEAVREGAGASGELLREPVVLDFDFTQPTP